MGLPSHQKRSCTEIDIQKTSCQKASCKLSGQLLCSASLAILHRKVSLRKSPFPECTLDARIDVELPSSMQTWQGQ